MRAIVLILLLLGLMTWVSPWFGGGPVKIEVADGFMSAESKSHYFEFDLGPTQTHRLYLLELRESNGFIKKMGFGYHAAMLSPQYFGKFQDIVDSGSCPAGFLNQHGQNFMLAVVDPAVTQELKRLEGRHEGREIQLSGNKLTFSMGESNGVPMHSFQMGGATALLVESIWDH